MVETRQNICSEIKFRRCQRAGEEKGSAADIEEEVICDLITQQVVINPVARVVGDGVCGGATSGRATVITPWCRWCR